MKKITLIILIILVLPLLAFSQTGDARTRGMANAFTAVADDYNALYFNPAGLASLHNTDLILGIGGNVTMTKELVFGGEDYPYIWEYWDGSGNTSYEYYDDFTGGSQFFDPSDYGFFWDDDDETTDIPDYQTAVDQYEEFQTYYSIYETMKNLSDINVFPRAVYASKFWGVSSIYEISLVPQATDEYQGEDSQFDFNLYKDVGLMGGLGIKLGPLSIGANVKYFTRTTDLVGFSAVDAEYGIPEEFFTNIVFGSEEGGTSEEGAHLEAGLGVLVALGSLNAGAYVDNFLYFVDLNGEEVVDGSFLETLSVGVAYTPFNQKNAKKRGALNFNAAIDLKNIGSEYFREFAAGLEVGINLGDVITADGRVGYNQAIPGALSDVSSVLDPRIATYSIGGGFRFLFGAMNFSMVMPADMVFDPPTGSLTDEELTTEFGTIVIDMHFVL